MVTWTCWRSRREMDAAAMDNIRRSCGECMMTPILDFTPPLGLKAAIFSCAAWHATELPPLFGKPFLPPSELIYHHEGYRFIELA